MQGMSGLQTDISTAGEKPITIKYAKDKGTRIDSGSGAVVILPSKEAYDYNADTKQWDKYDKTIETNLFTDSTLKVIKVDKVVAGKRDGADALDYKATISSLQPFALGQHVDASPLLTNSVSVDIWTDKSNKKVLAIELTQSGSKITYAFSHFGEDLFGADGLWAAAAEETHTTSNYAPSSPSTSTQKHPYVSGMTPTFGYNNKVVTVTITGQNLAQGTSFALTANGATDINGMVSDVSNDHVTCMFNLNGQKAGSRSLVITAMGSTRQNTGIGFSIQNATPGTTTTPGTVSTHPTQPTSIYK